MMPAASGAGGSSDAAGGASGTSGGASSANAPPKIAPMPPMQMMGMNGQPMPPHMVAMWMSAQGMQPPNAKPEEVQQQPPYVCVYVCVSRSVTLSDDLVVGPWVNALLYQNLCLVALGW